MTNCMWILILAIALAVVSHLAKPTPEKAHCCERHQRNRMLDPSIEEVIFCPTQGR